MTYTVSLEFPVDEGTSEASTACMMSTSYFDAKKDTNMRFLAVS